MRDAAVGVPSVVPGQVDVFPTDRRDVRKERIWKGDSMLPQCIDSTLQIDRVPQYDSKDDQVEAARAVTLVFESSVAD